MLDKKKKDKIKNDLLITTYYPTKELDYSIFDDIRNKLIEEYKKYNHDDLSDKLILESKKLDYFQNI